MIGTKRFATNALSIMALAATLATALTTTFGMTLQAETHCPGNVDSLRLPMASRSRILVPIEINHTGPYNFLLDTGAQVTMVDPALATELHLKVAGGAEFGGVGFLKHASLAHVDWIAAGGKSVADHLVLVQD